jgi:hypothetical protein
MERSFSRCHTPRHYSFSERLARNEFDRNAEPSAAANCSGRHSLCFHPQTCPRHLSAQAAPPSAVAELGVVRRLARVTLNADEQKQCLRASCMPLAFLVVPERRAQKPSGMEAYSESACFHRLRDCFWCVGEPMMAPFLSAEQSAALAEFERVYQSLPWRVIEAHPHISELPGDDLSPLMPAGERLLRLIEPQTHRHSRFHWLRRLFSS